jgi:hypothetical protein
MAAVVAHITVIDPVRSSPLRNAVFHVACKSAERSTRASTEPAMAICR